MACSARSTIPRRKAGSSSSSACATPVSPLPFASAIVVPSLTVGPTPHDLGGRWPLPSPGPASHFDRTIRTQPNDKPLFIEPWAEMEVRLLKGLTWFYVIHSQALVLWPTEFDGLRG